MQEQLVIESHGKEILISLRQPSEDLKIERPLYMKGLIRPQEMVCQRFMPMEHVYVKKQTCSCRKKWQTGAKIKTHVPRVEALLLQKESTDNSVA